SRRRHTRWPRDWSSDVCSSDLRATVVLPFSPLTIVSADGERDSPRATSAEVSSGSLVVTNTWNANVVTVVGTVNCQVLAEVVARSEERRVGKECRRRRWRDE